MTERQAGDVVQREGVIRRERGEALVGEDRGSAGAGLLGGLEEQQCAAARGTALPEDAGHRRDDRHVGT